MAQRKTSRKKLSTKAIAVMFIAMLASSEAIQVHRNVEAQKLVMGVSHAARAAMSGEGDDAEAGPAETTSSAAGAPPSATPSKKWSTSEVDQLDAQVRSVIMTEEFASKHPSKRNFGKLKIEIENFGKMMENMKQFDGMDENCDKAKLKELKDHLKKAGASSFMKFASGAMRFMKSSVFKRFKRKEAETAGAGLDKIKKALAKGGCTAVNIGDNGSIKLGPLKVPLKVPLDVEDLKKCLHAATPSADEEAASKNMKVEMAPMPKRKKSIFGRIKNFFTGGSAEEKMEKELEKDIAAEEATPGSPAQMAKAAEEGDVGSGNKAHQLPRTQVDQHPLQTSERSKDGSVATLFIETMHREAVESGNAEDIALWSGNTDFRVWFWAGILFAAVVSVILIIVLIKVIITLLIIFAICFAIAFAYFAMKDGGVFDLRRRRLLSPPGMGRPLRLPAAHLNKLLL